MSKSKIPAKVMADFNKKYEAPVDKLFDDFDKEIKRQRIQTATEANRLWNTPRFKGRLAKLEEEENIAYAKLWGKYYK